MAPTGARPTTCTDPRRRVFRTVAAARDAARLWPELEDVRNDTRMNRVAARERFFVLYPEQDRRANPHGCWNGTTPARTRLPGSVDPHRGDRQVCLFYPIDRNSIAVAGLSAGASMAALLVTRYPERFKAVVMHSGIAPGTAHSS